MMRAIFWKECREQGLIVTALSVLGIGLIIGMAILFPDGIDSQQTKIRILVNPTMLGLMMLLIVSGLVVGGTLIAGEKETGTSTFLDMLPAFRWKIWITKLGSGFVLANIIAIVLLATSSVAGVFPRGANLLGMLLFGWLIVMFAFAWGTFGSVISTNSLAACGQAAWLAPVVSAPVIFLTSYLSKEFTQSIGLARNQFLLPSELVATALAFVLPLFLSLWIYTKPDRSRVMQAELRKRSHTKKTFWPMVFSWFVVRGSWGSLFWLVRKQNQRIGYILFGLGAIAGVIMSIPAIPSFAVWPFVTLFVGVLLGVTVMGDEQVSGSFRFWMERRIPTTQLWLMKCLWCMACILIVCTIIISSMIASMYIQKYINDQNQYQSELQILGSKIFMAMQPPFMAMLFLWPVYGWVFGLLAGMLFRKVIVATAVGLMTSTALAALWLPSLFSGGIHPWQIWIPPLLGLATALSLMWLWTADQLSSKPAVLRISLGYTAVGVAMAGGLLYRAIEIPKTQTIQADEEFAKTIIPYDENFSGREYRRAESMYDRNIKRLTISEPLPSIKHRHSASEHRNTIGSRYPIEARMILGQLDAALIYGWPKNEPRLDEFLQATLASGWDGAMHSAATFPIGTIENPIEMLYIHELNITYNFQSMSIILLCDGLRLQHQDDPTAFVSNYRTVLHMVRSLRNKSASDQNYVASGIEIQAQLALSRWLDEGVTSDALLAEVQEIQQDHDAKCPMDRQEVWMANQVMLRNSIRSPGQLLDLWFAWPPGTRSDDPLRRGDNLASEIVGFSWAVPWEKERLNRLVGLGNSGSYPDGSTNYFRGVPGLSSYANYTNRQSSGSAKNWRTLIQQLLAHRHGLQILVGLERYYLANKKYPQQLDELVPEFLPSLPSDPYTNRERFRYRLSENERIQLEKQAKIPPATLESVGAVTGAGLMSIDSYPWFEEGKFDEEPRAGILLPNPNQPLIDEWKDGFSQDQERRLLIVPKNSAILWSIGPDGQDQNGKTLTLNYDTGSMKASAGDIIFVLLPQ